MLLPVSKIMFQPEEVTKRFTVDLPETMHRKLSILSAKTGRTVDLQTIDYARYTYRQSLIDTYDNLSFFIGSPKLYKLLSNSKFSRLGTIADVKVGLQTSDNSYYIRKRRGARGSYEILDESKLLTDADIAGLSDDEKRNGVDPNKYNGRCFLPFDKGGYYC